MSEAARELRTRGWTVLAEPRAPEAIEELARVLDRLRAEVGPAPLYAAEDLLLDESTKVSSVGLTFFGLLGRAPELADLFTGDDLVGLLREVLGPALELEQVTGVISDQTRPFFFWHHHVGGIDGEDFRTASSPPPGRVERVVCTVYATALDPAHGQMLVWPRAVGDTRAPPHAPGRSPWPGATRLDAPRGALVVLDEATWHAVTKMEAPGSRRFAACFVRRADLPPSRRIDPTIAPALDRSARLAACFRAAPALEDAPRGRG